MDLDREIAVLVTQFRDQVAELSLNAAREALNGAFAAQPGRGTRTTTLRAKGAKRDSGALEALRVKLAKTIEANPGRRIEEIAQALGLPTKELALPVRQLLASKVIMKKGKRRGTTYFPKS